MLSIPLVLIRKLSGTCPFSPLDLPLVLMRSMVLEKELIRQNCSKRPLTKTADPGNTGRSTPFALRSSTGTASTGDDEADRDRRSYGSE
jgi:hypothetical protein